MQLSDGTEICRDFTVAKVVNDPGKLRAIQEALSVADQPDPVIGRTSLNNALDDVSGFSLSIQEFNALMSCLTNEGAATEVETSPRGYAHYKFQLDPSQAVRILDQQIVGLVASGAFSPSEHGTDVRVVATLPDEVNVETDLLVNETNISLRKLVMSANSSVRIANPYFDPSQRIIQDLAALPKRGVHTKILTREAGAESISDQKLEVLTALVRNLDNSELEYIDVRDYYRLNEAGNQIGAIHAKMVIVDEEKCYLGSANLTALNLQGNFEIGVLLTGDIVSTLTEVFDAVFENADSVAL